MQIPLRLTTGLLCLPLYLAVTLLIGWASRRKNGSANEYLNATRSLSLPIVTAAYLAANCGALEVVGLSAMAAQYGVQAFHFYWIGAIPAMVFLGLWMMPMYRRTGIRTVPEFLELRYGPGVRLLNACVLAVTMLLLAGISLYAMALVLEVVIGFNFAVSVLLSASVVLAYVLLGGIRATIYNEVFQLAVMIAGLVPLAFRAVRLDAPFAKAALHGPSVDARYHVWSGLPAVSHTAPFDAVGVVFGLGFVLSFGYWCTDFVLMQRAFTARTEMSARQVPLWAGFGKLLFSLVVVLPGVAAFHLLPDLGRSQRYDQALPALMTVLYGPVMLGLGLTALAASLMSGLAANVSAFATIWTEDIYHARLRPRQQDSHYLRMGRLSAVVAIVISTLASYLNFFFSNLMEHVQLIFSVLGSPFWAIFLLGVSTRRTTARGATAGFCCGAGVSLLHRLAFVHGGIGYGSVMSANFYGAIYAFFTACVVSLLASGFRAPTLSPEAAGKIFAWRGQRAPESKALLWTLSAALLLACLLLNLVWR